MLFENTFEDIDSNPELYKKVCSSVVDHLSEMYQRRRKQFYKFVCLFLLFIPISFATDVVVFCVQCIYVQILTYIKTKKKLHSIVIMKPCLKKYIYKV